jgi:serine/threonine-protein kinase
VSAARPGHEFAYPYCLFAEGLARYRQGRFDDAIKLMTGEAASVMGPCPRLILAMAQFQKGQQQEALESLAAAISSHDWSESKEDNHDAWIAHILRREAEAMFGLNLPAVPVLDELLDENLLLLGLPYPTKNLSKPRGHGGVESALAADDLEDLRSGHTPDGDGLQHTVLLH